MVKHRQSAQRRLRDKFPFMFTAGFVILALVAVFVSMQYSQRMQGLFENQAKSKIQQVTNQNVQMMRTAVYSCRDFLYAVAATIQHNNVTDVNQLLAQFGSYLSIYRFHDMAIMTPDGVCRTTRGNVLNLKNSDMYSIFEDGSWKIQNLSDTDGQGTPLNVFGVPVMNNGKVQFVLMASYNMRSLPDVANLLHFEGYGQSAVLDAEYHVVARTEEQDVGEVLKAQGLDLSQTNPMGSENRFIQFRMNNTDYLGYCQPMGVDDWYLMTYVSQGYLNQEMNDFRTNIQRGVLMVVALVATFCILFLLYYARHKKSINHMMFDDTLTGAKNYEFLKIRFEEQNWAGSEHIALVVMDIDKLKLINMLYGMAVGDQAILYLYHAFRRVLPTDEIYRRHADEYVAIIRYTTPENLEEKLRQLNSEIQRGVRQNEVCNMKVSMGVCPTEGYSTFRRIYGNAIIAKREVKGSSQHFYRIFDQDLSEQFLQSGRIENEFALALKNEQFHVWYQPKVDLDTGEIVGAEALVRWKKESGQTVSPARFIPIFEQNGQIVRLDERVIRNVCRDIQDMKKRGIPVVPVSVNLSRLHLHHPGIVKRIDELTAQYGIEHDEIAIEITESALLDAKDSLRELMSQLHQRGYRVDMDDYGSGMSGIGSLAALPFDTIKMDKSFVDHIGDRKMDVVIKSTIQMARELNLEIVFEGIETEEQAEFLRNSKCKIGQGYYFSRPLERSDYERLLLERGTKREGVTDAW